MRKKLLSFMVAGRKLALPLETVRYVAPLPLLQPPIAAPAFLEGFFDFQGAPVAALRLDRLFGLPDAAPSLYAPLLILADAAEAVALHVDRIDRVIAIDSDAMQAIDSDATFNGCVTARLDDGCDTLYIVDPCRLLLAAERERLAAHQAMMQRRLQDVGFDARHLS
jgi:chemotaxis signal transduction protein